MKPTLARPLTLLGALCAVMLSASSAAAKGCEDTAEFTPATKPDTRIVNNIWNRNVEGAQCSFDGRFDGLPIDGPGKGPALGSWIWRWGHVDFTPHSYPSIAFGHQPWRSYSTTKTLPARVSDVESIDTAYTLKVEATGSYNTSFDMWFTTAKKPRPKEISTEIMVWVGAQEMKPHGELVEEVTVGGRRYELWHGKVDWWRYVVFVDKNPSGSGTLDLKPLVDETVRRGWIEPRHYLTVVEFGTEIVSGIGKAVLEQFDVKARIKEKGAAKSK